VRRNPLPLINTAAACPLIWRQGFVGDPETLVKIFAARCWLSAQ